MYHEVTKNTMVTKGLFQHRTSCLAVLPSWLRDEIVDAMKAILDHVGIAVSDLQAALAFYRDALGLAVEPPEDVPSQKVRAHFVPVGPSSLELLEATSPDSAIAKYVEKRGPGLHHITLRVDDIRAALAQLKARLDDAEDIAEDVFPRILYGAKHPCGRPHLGTPQSVEGLTREDIVNFHKKLFLPNNAALIVVGDTTPDAITESLEKALKSWQPGDAPASAALPAPSRSFRPCACSSVTPRSRTARC